MSIAFRTEPGHENDGQRIAELIEPLPNSMTPGVAGASPRPLASSGSALLLSQHERDLSPGRLLHAARMGAAFLLLDGVAVP